MSKNIQQKKNIKFIKAYEDGVGSTREIMSLYTISRFAFYDWRNRGVKTTKRWKKYSQVMYLMEKML